MGTTDARGWITKAPFKSVEERRRLRSEISPDFADRFIKMHILDCDGGIYDS